MTAIELILMIIFATGFGVFFTLCVRKHKEYIKLQSDYEVIRESRDIYYDLANARLKTNNELKKRLNAMPMQPYNVTRIECFQQPIKDIRHVVEINPYEFSHMSDAEIEDMVKKEVFKHIFEAAEPLVEFVIEDCPIEPSRKFMGRLKVVEPNKEELK